MTRQISVDGMSCEHCEQTVEDALIAIDGVTGATADHEAGTVTIDGDADRETLIDTVVDAGYGVA